MKKNTFWLVIIAGLAVAALAFALILPRFREEGDLVRIRQEQEVLYLLPLNEDKRLTIPYGDGYNLVVIENGQVYVAEASCPDQTCVRHKPTSQTKDPIVCLPHRLEVEVLRSGTGELDGVSG